ncbi:hypothetical protein [Streptosporangium longisporum]|uniref:Uncharacterized protein n=1 Tax=Streptosporangium longisporum TaxID=46187 RepID=A0ABN3Y5M1_9ACTN
MYLLINDSARKRAIIGGLASGLSFKEACARAEVKELTALVCRHKDQEFDRAVVEAASRHGKVLRSLHVGMPPYKDRELQARILQDIATTGARADALAKVAQRYGFRVRHFWIWGRMDDLWRGRINRLLMSVRDPNLPHGTSPAYRKHKCRCPPCRSLTLTKEKRRQVLAEYQA